MATVTNIQRLLKLLRDAGVGYYYHNGKYVIIYSGGCEITTIPLNDVRKNVEKVIERVEFEVALHKLLQ